MFKNYLDLLKNIFNNIFNNSNATVTIQDYLMTLFYSFSIVLVFILILTLLYFTIKLPKVIYKYLLKKPYSSYMEILDCIKNTSDENDIINFNNQLSKVDIKIHKYKMLYIVFIMFIYIPIVFPIILIVLDIISNKIF